MSELQEYKNDLYQQASISADLDNVFPEESFFENVTEMLSEAGILDNVEYCPYRNTSKGMKIDGYSWNALEKTICGILLNFTNEPDTVMTLTQTKINEATRRVTKFFEKVQDDKFLESLEVTDPGRIAACDLREHMDEAIKFRIVFITDETLSARVKKVSIGKILNLDTSVEIWDLERLKDLDQSGTDYEEFTVDALSLGNGIKVLPANISNNGVSTYLGVMPGQLLSAIYDEYGQRLLESNVRTFLDFRAATNRGMRKSLVTEPENFFAYNNGLTVTATSIKTEMVEGQLVITELENMQIVNGGQTTASIYFSPKEKGGIKGAGSDHLYKDIDLSKVNVQMKLTVVGHKETADLLKTNIATYANSQNSIQQSDLVSNHPFHLNIETRSRNQLMPAGESGLPTKWFYERTRGQYSTQLRALGSQRRRKFEAEYPKKQVFSKIEMAKYENTWRMKPHTVKRGAQANLKALGAEIIAEYEKDEEAFGASFFRDLVAKMILYRQTDHAVLVSEWYKAERGLKIEAVTYALALLVFKLREEKKELSLEKIYLNQSISESLSIFIVKLAREVREKISDQNFRDGAQNPSEFCKSEKGWLKIQKLEIDISELDEADLISGKEIQEARKEKKEINKASKTISSLETVMQVGLEEWKAIAEFNSKKYDYSHISVGIPLKCVQLHMSGKMPSIKQLENALKIRSNAYSDGFDFVQ